MNLQCTALVAFLSCLACVHACSQPKRIKCPAVIVQPVFDLNRYLDRWYEMERVPQPFQQGGACVTATYTLSDIAIDGVTYPVTVVNRMSTEAESITSITGGARTFDLSGDGKLRIRFPVAPTEGDYWILDTDYVNYSVVYACSDDGAGTIKESSWILTRVNDPSTETWRKIDAAIARSGIDRQAYKKTRHDASCVYVQPSPLHS